MRICHFLSSDTYAGIEQYVDEISNEQSHNHQVIIITNRLEAQIILVQVTLDRVLDIAQHQAHHFQEVVEVCRQDQVHPEVVNLVDNF